MSPGGPDSFGARSALAVGSDSYTIYALSAVPGAERLPFCLKVLLENLLRREGSQGVTADDITALASWDGGGDQREIAFAPARVLLQDFTGVPVVADLAAMRDAMVSWGSDPAVINPVVPLELVIDHSVQVDFYGTPDAFARNVSLEFERNLERYRFLRWGQRAFRNFALVPPGTGICHQVDLEYLSRVVFVDDDRVAYPDTVVGTDSHTPMVNGIGVVGWGVGGIEAEAAMLGQPISMLVPPVVGLELTGELPAGSTATDLVLTIAELLRAHGVVGKFVEIFGDGVARVPAESRATIGNMSPEYGCTITVFPIDAETLRYLRMTGRSEAQVSLVEYYAKAQGLWHDAGEPPPVFSEVVRLDLSTVVPSLAGPSRPQDRIPLDRSKQAFAKALERFRQSSPPARVEVGLPDGKSCEIGDGSVVIAAITSCTNTSNPSVMVAAGLLARNARSRGLSSKPWVKTSLAPGSKVVMDYLERAGLVSPLEELGFSLVGFGCTTCIGNSGPLAHQVSRAVNENDLAVAAVLSGNRNFEGRIHSDVRLNYLASPPLVVAYALAGTVDIDFYSEPLGYGRDSEPVYLHDIWPSPADVADAVAQSIDPEMFRKSYAEVFDGDERWKALEVPRGELYEWDAHSTYVQQPPFFRSLADEPDGQKDIESGRALVVLGDSVTTDHISPAGSIKTDSPAGRWLIERGVAPADFNSYGARRGNHEVMVRGTFANTRIKNRLVPGLEGGFTVCIDSDDPDAVVSVYDAAASYAERKVPLLVLAGKEYGSGSSRDWAAKGVALLGVRAVVAESFERIHRSNLIGMGVLPLEFAGGATIDSLGLTGRELYSVEGLSGWRPPEPLQGRIVVKADGRKIPVVVRIDTPTEAEYYWHGGILPYVLRSLRRR